MTSLYWAKSIAGASSAMTLRASSVADGTTSAAGVAPASGSPDAGAASAASGAVSAAGSALCVESSAVSADASVCPSAGSPTEFLIGSLFFRLGQTELECLGGKADVFESETHLRHPRRASAIGPGKDHVIHRLAAEVLGRLLAHAPANRIDDIRLATTVWSHDSGHRFVKGQNRPITERFKTNYFDPLYAH